MHTHAEHAWGCEKAFSLSIQDFSVLLSPNAKIYHWHHEQDPAEGAYTMT